MKKLFLSIKNKMHKKIVDVLITIALTIIIITTIKLNVYIGLYTLAAILILLSIVISRYGGGED